MANFAAFVRRIKLSTKLIFLMSDATDIIMGGVIALCSIFDLELSNISNAGTLENAINILNFFYLHCIASNNTRLELPLTT